MHSIQKKLLGWLTVGIIAALSMSGVIIYYTALSEANNIFDYHLQQAALSLPDTPAEDSNDGPEDLDQDLMIQVWDLENNLIYNSRPAWAMPHYNKQGFHTVNAFDDQWRVYSENRRANFIQVSQPTKIRNQLAVSLALRLLMPFLLLIPALLVMTSLVVKHNLLPLQNMANTLQQSNIFNLHGLLIENDLPLELQPIVHALNELLTKLEQALAGQRAFIADAAHELRSPLTALKLQVELIKRADSDITRQQGIIKLDERLKRTIHLIEQMLTLARQEANSTHPVFEVIKLNPILDQFAEDYELLAEQRGIQFILEKPSGAIFIHSQEDKIQVLLKNLLDNALKYTPKGGSITLRIEKSDRVVLNVLDTGKGIVAEERERVFDRFYRCVGDETFGTGLGLAIVKQIVEQHGARLTLHDNPNGSGLWVSISFPLSQ